MLIVELILNDIYIVFFVDGKWGEGVLYLNGEFLLINIFIFYFILV